MSSDSTVKPLIPNWLDSKFLEGILRNYYKNDGIKLIRFDVRSTASNGESFMSSMYRAKVDFKLSLEAADGQESTLHLIIKAAIDELKDALSNFDVYEKEVEFYDQIAPKINAKLKDLNEPQLLPECYGVCKEKKIMVIEDLSAKGYTTLHGPNKCNISEAKAILKRIAVFNGIGVVLREDKSDIFANFKSGHLSRDVLVFVDMYKGLFDALLDTISSWPEFSSYHEKLSSFRKNLPERWHQALDLNPNHLNALVHNDLWPPNIMIRGETISVDAPFENITFIDFQNTLWGSPAADLHLFLNMSMCESLMPDRFDELVEFYYSQLVSVLRKLNCKCIIPTWTEFHSQYFDRKFLAFIASCLEQSVTIDNNGDVEYNDLIVNDERSMKIKRKLYQKPKVQVLLRKMIPYYVQIGTFD
ncbi:uncharacterized protein LOC119083172 [Bradysia coprophila]|uniref:uncharacterized protein LOC119083172 n=1 Tax=Bradysia coprophila TaxID=38358 RepID=UPI00187DC61A|nr:uncharacterized protein LOC119083172 [Bradysia coprophila]